MPLRIVKSSNSRLRLVDFVPLFAKPLGVEAVGHAHARRVIGDGDVFEAALDRGDDHFAERGFAVAGRGVHVQVADEVGHFDQLRQLAGSGPGEFLPRFADFGREPRQVKRRVDFFLGAAGDVVGEFDVVTGGSSCSYLRQASFACRYGDRKTPYSLIRSPRSLAMPRRTTL